MDTTNRGTTKLHVKLDPSWALERLEILARRREARVDGKSIALMVSSVSGFTQEALEAACADLENEEIQQFSPRWPDAGKLVGLCRHFMQNGRPANQWPMDRFRLVWYFDRYIDEQMREGRTREDVIREFPYMGPMWSSWKTQMAKGTIQKPRGWCEECQGSGWLPAHTPSGEHAMKSCGCRTRTA
jgi:hypothetical protein